MTELARFFFLHIMKTGGTTFRFHAQANFGRKGVYPNKLLDGDVHRAYMDIDRLFDIAPERRRQIRCYMGHFPFYAATAAVPDAITMTILRDPIERTMSLLKNMHTWPDEHLHRMSYEEIYDSEHYHLMFIRNFQVRQFALRASDAPESHLHHVDIDDARLAAAIEHLDQIDVLGLHDEYGAFLRALEADHGWRFGEIPKQRVSPERDVSADLRRRIALDNAADVEFFAAARARFERAQRHQAFR
jgi:hypothetical protein